MNRSVIVALVLALAAAGLHAQEEEEMTDEEIAALPRAIVIQDETPMMYGEEKIGELAEGTTVRVVRSRGDWLRVRAVLGGNWFEGWVREALTVRDTLTGVKVAVAPPRRHYDYEGQTLPGMQFIEIRVKFGGTADGPSRLYFHWEDKATADIFLNYGREGRAVPHGFMRPKPLSSRRVFETEETRHMIRLSAGGEARETFVFAVPLRARAFELVLKGRVFELRGGR